MCIDWLNFIVIPVLSSAVVALVLTLLQRRAETRKSTRILRRELTGLIEEIRVGMVREEDKGAIKKRLTRIVDMFDIAFPYKKRPSVIDGKKHYGVLGDKQIGDE